MRAVEDAASAASTAAELAYNMTNKTVLDILYTYQVENFGDSCVWFSIYDSDVENFERTT